MERLLSKQLLLKVKYLIAEYSLVNLRGAAVAWRQSHARMGSRSDSMAVGSGVEARRRSQKERFLGREGNGGSRAKGAPQSNTMIAKDYVLRSVVKGMPAPWENLLPRLNQTRILVPPKTENVAWLACWK